MTISSASASVSFGYDPLGRCVKRVSATTTYLYYDGWNLIQEGANYASADRIYIHGTRVDEVVADQAAGSVWSYHHYDARGHCILLTDASANLVEQYSYDAFGKVYYYDGAGNALSDTARGNRFLFTGREWLSTLRLYDYRNRLYLPELGRFIQPDPKEFEAGDYNLYRYCHNDPVNHSDPTGMFMTMSLGHAMLSYCDMQMSLGDFKLGVAIANIFNALSKGNPTLAQIGFMNGEGRKVLINVTGKSRLDKFVTDLNGKELKDKPAATRGVLWVVVGNQKLVVVNVYTDTQYATAAGPKSQKFAMDHEWENVQGHIDWGDSHVTHDAAYAAANSYSGSSNEGLRNAVDNALRPSFQNMQAQLRWDHDNPINGTHRTGIPFDQ